METNKIKLFAALKNGQLTDSYHTYYAQDKFSAAMDFIADYCEVPEKIGLEIVECVPVSGLSLTPELPEGKIK